MFYPQEMTETQIIIPEKDLIAATKALAKYQNFYQVDANYINEDVKFNSANLWKEQEISYRTQERRILNIMQTLGVDEEAEPVNHSISIIDSDMVSTMLNQIEKEVDSVKDELSGEYKRLERLYGYLNQLEPIAEVDFDISDLNHTQYIFSMLGVMPTENIRRLETSLMRIPFILLTLRQDDEKAVVWLAGTCKRANILERAARSAYLNPLKLPAVHQGTPAQVINSLHTAIKRTEDAIAVQKSIISQQAKAYQQQLQTLLWMVRASRIMADAIARFGQLHYTYLIVGWVPASKLEDLRQRLKEVSTKIVIDTFPSRRDNAEKNVPVVLNNPGLLGPFQQLVTIFAQPRYTELDPTFLMAITFPLLFGAMFGDVGHGLLLALFGGLLISRKVPVLRGLAGLGGLITICGLAATAFGFLYGSVFGVEHILQAIWINPMENIMQILMIAIGAGVVILSIGFILSMVNSVISQDWGRLFFDPTGLAGFILYWSLLGLLAGNFIEGFPVPSFVFIITVAVSGLLVMFSEILKHLVKNQRPLIEGGIGTYAVQAFFELFETLIGFLSNTLSYVRVGAFAVAHGGLSAVIFILAALASPGHGIGYWIVFVIGTLFIVGFEGLIVGIQTMRLEYYEFFSKFFEGGGTQHKPLALLTVSKE